MAKYQPLETINISPTNLQLTINKPPELIHFDDPAFMAMVDFKKMTPNTILQSTDLETAQHEMEFHGTHFMLVLNDQDQLIGVITASDLLGEKPIKVASSTGLTHNNIPVDRLMTQITDVPALDIDAVSYARVAHIIKTLHEIKSPYALVLKQIDNDTQKLRGYFSTSQMSKQLHRNVRLGAIDIDNL